uniref:Uncharacterized mitochondrial protein AtMg00810-like n=1 Tax=Tanacetum cinerariifolium TaxID=118510 RepID=A0A699IMV8_TANCI|nr:uncharacterized mitochondrial protein AtMg00810-like [Tanacetum cinerariifolium]
MISMGELTFFLGLQVKQKDDGIFISQDKYVADILKKFDFATAYTYYCQMKVNAATHKLTTAGEVKTIFEDVQIRALVDGKKIIITEASIRCDLRLDDAEGNACLPNAAIFKELARMGLTTRVESSKEEEGLGDQEDASKQGRKAKLDANEDLSLINETAQDQGRMNDEDLLELMILMDDVALAQTLMEIKATKPKAKRVIIQDPSKFRTTSSSQPSQPLQAKDKGKGIMMEPEKPLKKKDQIAFDEEVARKLDAQMKAEIEEEERIAREKNKANRAVTEE